MLNTNSIDKTSSLMKTILIERFNDLDKLEQLCKELLNIAQGNHDDYGIAFANLYLLDAFYTRGDYKNSRFYLIQTQTLCKKNDFKDLLVVFHNLAGLYFQDLFDEHAAVQHYIKGLEIAHILDDAITESKIYNNLGICFRRRYDNEAALFYFNKAYETIKDHISDDVCGTVISFLCNASEIYQAMNQASESKERLDKAQALYVDNRYSYFQIKSAWCCHYAISGEADKSIAIAKQLIEEGLCEFDHVPFVTSVYFEIFDHMLWIDCKPYAKRYLTLLEACCSYKNIGDYYNYKTRKIRYHERYGNDTQCHASYYEFYETSKRLNEVNNSIYVKNVLSKIELTQALFELNSLEKENKQLENTSHIDELTRLYNRRYVTKLQTKVMMGRHGVLLGYVMLDVDYFKEYNDYYGHSKGDEALQCVADILLQNEDNNIFASRFGGDEFLILFVDHTKEEILAYIQHIQDDLKSRNVPHEKSKISNFLTISIGYSTRLVSNEEMHAHLLNCVDEALYQAKSDGRNCFRYHAT